MNYRCSAFIAMISVLCCGDAFATDANWILLTQSYGGTVSLNRNLTKEQCGRLRRIVLRVDDLSRVEEVFQQLMAKSWEDYHEALAWRDAHPQCKHVMWNGGAEDLKPDKDGYCINPPNNALGPENDGKNWNPDNNPLIAKVNRDAALQRLGFPAVGKDGKPGDIKSAECIR